MIPFIKLPGPVEVDETVIGRNNHLPKSYLPKIMRYVFGFFCRHTKIPIMYYLEGKRVGYIEDYFKKHMYPGSVIFSDNFAAYVNLNACHSQLAKYGFYHFWQNHSEFFVHSKFEFNNTNRIEFQWWQVKRGYHVGRYKTSFKEITEHIRQYMFRMLVKKESLYYAMLTIMKKYYFENLALFKLKTKYQEDFYPRIFSFEKFHQDSSVKEFLEMTKDQTFFEQSKTHICDRGLFSNTELISYEDFNHQERGDIFIRDMYDQLSVKKAGWFMKRSLEIIGSDLSKVGPYKYKEFSAKDQQELL